MKILYQALLKGYSLPFPELFKRLQQLIQLIMGVAPALLIFFPQYGALLNAENLVKLEAGLGTLSIYLTQATTEKLGGL
jgi:hypothetical protein